MDNRTVVDCSHNIDNSTAVGMVVVGMVVDIVVDKHMIVSP